MRGRLWDEGFLSTFCLQGPAGCHVLEEESGDEKKAKQTLELSPHSLTKLSLVGGHPDPCGDSQHTWSECQYDSCWPSLLKSKFTKLLSA